jgi:folate-binding protein YgfZ
VTRDEGRTADDERRATNDERGATHDGRALSAAYRAARERVTFRRRHERGVLRATGKDRLDWLQGLLTNDVKSFDGVGWSYSAWLTPQGRMITDMAVVEIGDEAWLDVPAPLSRSLAQKLDLMIFAEDVKIEDVSDRLGSVAVDGPGAWPMVASVLPTGIAPLDLGGMAIVRDGLDPIVIARARTGSDGFVLYSSLARAAGLEESLAHGGALPLDDDSAETLRIEAGVPRFLVDMTEETIPLEANLDHAISHTKGCYVGQEIIVRIRDLAKGRVARRLVGLLPEGDAVPLVGATVVAGGKSVGRITSATWSPALARPVAMAVVHRDYTAPGTTVTIDGASAAVASLPFVEGRAQAV